jgi:hypothetical protein
MSSKRGPTCKRVKGRVRECEFKSNLEKEFYAYLKLMRNNGKIKWFSYEPFSLKIGANMQYRPDFAVITDDDELVFYEVKGFMREDSWIKLKAAASRYPFAFYLVRKNRGHWQIDEVPSDFNYDYIEDVGGENA